MAVKGVIHMAGWPGTYDYPERFEKALGEALARTHGDFMNLPGVTGYGLAQQGDYDVPKISDSIPKADEIHWNLCPTTNVSSAPLSKPKWPWN
ncbi:MAG: hypothetical protein HYZ69_03105 [Candidatus Colwellbacteria bacterium]|nr:hypothetical protein [Candidatus Colwellbacteria bacterium]